MLIDLSGKTSIISASTGGIGLATAKGLAESGAHVILNGRSEKTVERALEHVRAECPEAKLEGLVADLSTQEGAEKLFSCYPVCDILINNLGIFDRRDFFEMSDQEWARFFDVNVLSSVRLARFYLPVMKKSGWGRVVFISSQCALTVPSGLIHYASTKAAMLAIARGLAKSMAGTGVTVNSILPGPTFTEGMVDWVREEADRDGTSVQVTLDKFVRTAHPESIIQRIATAEEVANMIIYICSQQASATTGAALRVEGGMIDTL